MAFETETRGAHAFGLAWVDGFGTLRMYKQPGPISRSLWALSLVKGARMVIGHCRYATMGPPSDNQNNHPHPINGGWFVHNGKVRNYGHLVRAFGLMPVTDCDSEAIGLLAEIQGGRNPDRLLHASLAVEEGPLAVLGLWARPAALVAIRRGHPLHLGTTRGDAYLASLAGGLPANVSAVKNRSAVVFDRKGVKHVDF